MSTIRRCWIFIIIVCLFFVGSSSFAQGPDFRPRGWDKGEKKGWDSDVPLGLGKKSEHDNDSDDASGDKDKRKNKEKKKKHKKNKN